MNSVVNLLTAQDVASPCIGVCALDVDNVCMGCNRTLSEIGEWAAASAHRKQEILQLVDRRRADTSLEGHP